MDAPHADFDPATVAEDLPPRPLTPNEAADIADRLGCSLRRVTYETGEGTPVVPVLYLFAHEEFPDDGSVPAARIRGDALEYYYDDRRHDWAVELHETETTLDRWIQANEAHANTLGLELSQGGVEFDVDWQFRGYEGQDLPTE